jgi:hypothetical protein
VYEMRDLWPDFESSAIETNNSIDILRSQAREISKKTEQAVKATFSKLEYKQGPLAATVAVQQIIGALGSTTYEELLDQELQGKKDANKFYSVTKYKFEIYNDEYRFRLFVLENREIFPICLVVDDGICEEIRYKNRSNIMSNEELEDVLQEIFCSSKVRSIVTRMIQTKTKGR